MAPASLGLENICRHQYLRNLASWAAFERHVVFDLKWKTFRPYFFAEGLFERHHLMHTQLRAMKRNKYATDTTNLDFASRVLGVLVPNTSAAERSVYKTVVQSRVVQPNVLVCACVKSFSIVWGHAIEHLIRTVAKCPDISHSMFLLVENQSDPLQSFAPRDMAAGVVRTNEGRASWNYAFQFNSASQHTERATPATVMRFCMCGRPSFQQPVIPENMISSAKLLCGRVIAHRIRLRLMRREFLRVGPFALYPDLKRALYWNARLFNRDAKQGPVLLRRPQMEAAADKLRRVLGAQRSVQIIGGPLLFSRVVPSDWQRSASALLPGLHTVPSIESLTMPTLFSINPILFSALLQRLPNEDEMKWIVDMFFENRQSILRWVPETSFRFRLQSELPKPTAFLGAMKGLQLIEMLGTPC
jgi:hypothetical protein